MDIVLGSISFMLNKKNEVVPKGAIERGHRTIAKEKLFYRYQHDNSYYYSKGLLDNAIPSLDIHDA